MCTKRRHAGWSKPNCFSSWWTSSGSMPREARESPASPLPGRAPPPLTSPPPVPLTRAVAVMVAPRIRASMRSTGPPGAACTMTKFASMIPNRVGMTSSSRRAR
jgi:hypothetical protein